MSNTVCNAVTSSFVTQPQRNATPDPTRPDPSTYVALNVSRSPRIAELSSGATCEVPASPADPTNRQCDQDCPVLAETKAQLRAAREALAAVRDVARERAGR